jgi:hypothetical protein
MVNVPTDEFGRQERLLVLATHRPECTFGPGVYRISYRGAHSLQTRYCQNEREVGDVYRLLDGVVKDLRVERDGLCLDHFVAGDARTPDVVDAEWWLGLSVADGMRELGLSTEGEYRETYQAIEAAVARRNDRAAQGGVRASIVIKRKGAKVTDVG